MGVREMNGWTWVLIAVGVAFGGILALSVPEIRRYRRLSRM